MLAIGTALPMILGFFFVRPIPPPHLEATSRLEHGALADSSEYGVVEGLVAGTPTTFSVANSSSTHLLARDDEDDDEDEEGSLRPAREAAIELEEEEGLVSHAHTQVASDYVVPSSANALMMSPTRAGFPRQRSTARSTSRRSGRSHLDKSYDDTPNIYGKRMFKTLDFWLLFGICSLRKMPFLRSRTPLIPVL